MHEAPFNIRLFQFLLAVYHNSYERMDKRTYGWSQIKLRILPIVKVCGPTQSTVTGVWIDVRDEVFLILWQNYLSGKNVYTS